MLSARQRCSRLYSYTVKRPTSSSSSPPSRLARARTFRSRPERRCDAAKAISLSIPMYESSSSLHWRGLALLAAGLSLGHAGGSSDCSALPLGADANMLSPVSEPATGILFPRLCNAMTLVGCGVRIKWGFVKVYAVGTYMDPLAMSAVKSRGENEIAKALLDPAYPRTIRIVMNRGLSIDKYTAAIIEAIEPRMNGEDLDKLQEFKKLNPAVDLVKGADMEMTIRGDTLLYKNAVGGLGQIKSIVFTKALCDVYYGNEAVSPTHKEQVIKNLPNL